MSTYHELKESLPTPSPSAPPPEDASEPAAEDSIDAEAPQQGANDSHAAAAESGAPSDAVVVGVPVPMSQQLPHPAATDSTQPVELGSQWVCTGHSPNGQPVFQPVQGSMWVGNQLASSVGRFVAPQAAAEGGREVLLPGGPIILAADDFPPWKCTLFVCCMVMSVFAPLIGLVMSFVTWLLNRDAARGSPRARWNTMVLCFSIACSVIWSLVLTVAEE
ncbi:unnamed protein product [Vitrella brassicaformis CCMP3155]|uniref:Uncharacterized protein n=1 Tax=Vitrella brassicaformis (strain CCMP3155) TaxID=1169540 RepID=A0A0G4GFR2_VITBC|nr:unnamed protein product [Vitrella brassicaformis CCMP3155]|mmetsp:Transcript_23076/g.57037  ORF Transcript_23076/g.57037 Transcript_23076/m.57037 type:complete len:219 (-) Transcript_23076:474-1130(-)|eukprot:CEM28363.1 unnamed protein product [Vitrella brassicaformis CCMP3155]